MNGDNSKRRAGQYRRYGNNLGLERTAHDADSNLGAVSREGLAKKPGLGGAKTLGSMVASEAIKGAKVAGKGVKKLIGKL